MTLPVPVRIAARELRGGLAAFRIFLVCLALGVAAIAGVGTVRASIEAGLAREGARLLGGDAEATFTYRFARDDERAWMESVADRVSETVDFRSLLVAGEGLADRALTQVRAVDDAYPLIGKVGLDPPMPLDAALAGDGTNPGLVAERLLVDRLGLAPGDTVRLGTQDFTLMAVLDSYPDAAAGGFGLGPRSIVRTGALEGSGLLVEGTLFDTAYRLDLPEGADLAAIAAEAETLFRDTGLRWEDARSGADGIALFVDRLGAFLILVGLAGLAVGGIGVSAAVRDYLGRKTPVIATLRTLGATRGQVFAAYFAQVGALTTLGIALGLALGGGIPLAFAPLIEARLPVPAEFRLWPGPLGEAALYGLLAALIFTLWPLARTENIRAATLFRDAALGLTGWPRPRYWLATAALAAALVAAAGWLSESWWLTLWTAGGILGALAILALAGRLIRGAARPAARAARGRTALRTALGAIGARGGDTVPVVLSLGLGLSVLAAVGQIDGTLRGAIQTELPEVAPSFFFVDIQPDQIEGFLDRANSDPGVSRVEAAPMLRGIITRINGLDAREVAGGHWVLDGDRGITYSAAPPEGTVITEGAWWPEDYAGPPLVSFSAEEAAEMGLKIGDRLTINILGRDIEAEIASFREVNFENAGIGFILSMNPAALAGAPHSWIATVYAEDAAEAPLLRDLASTYPNITAIPVADAIAQVAELLSGISSAVRWGAAAALLTGLFVLIGSAAAGETARAREAAILKTLGATRARLLWSFALRQVILGAVAGAVALVAGILGGWAVATFVMETDYAVIWGNALAIVSLGAALSLLAGLGFALRSLRVKPARVLRAAD